MSEEIDDPSSRCGHNVKMPRWTFIAGLFIQIVSQRIQMRLKGFWNALHMNGRRKRRK